MKSGESRKRRGAEHDGKQRTILVVWGTRGYSRSAAYQGTARKSPSRKSLTTGLHTTTLHDGQIDTQAIVR
jgi:hypothetical protein